MSKSRANERHSQSSEWVDDFASETSDGGSPRSDTPAVVPKTRTAPSPLDGPRPIPVYLAESDGLDAFAADQPEDREPTGRTALTVAPPSLVSRRAATGGTAGPLTAKTPTPTPRVSAAAWLANAPLRPSHPPPHSYRLEKRRRSAVDIFLYVAASVATLVAVTVGMMTLQGPVAEEPSTTQPALTRNDAVVPSPTVTPQNSPQVTSDRPDPPAPRTLETRENTAPATGRSRIAGLAPLPQPTTG